MTVRRPVRTAVVAVAGLVAGAGVLACAAGGIGGPQYACDTHPAVPWVTTDYLTHVLPVITTFTWSDCAAGAVLAHHVTVWLEVNQPVNEVDRWVRARNGAVNDQAECSDIPTPAGVQCQFFIPCETGEYRTRVSVLYTDTNGESGTFSPDEERKATILCP